MKNEEAWEYYWCCCGKTHSAKSLKIARIELEDHEKKSHKEKPIGTFGMKKWVD